MKFVISNKSNTFIEKHILLENKTIIITGGNNGIGLATAKILANTAAKIIITARDVQKGKAAVAAIKSHSGNANIHLQLLDLERLDNIRIAAKELLKNNEHIDVLINNAGVYLLHREQTPHGFEKQFGINHLGHFLLTHLLLPKIEATAKAKTEARIIMVSSGAHKRTEGIHFDDLQWTKRKFDPIKPYAESKLANILMANEIARRYGHSGIYAHSLHPGMIKSNIYRNGNIKGLKGLIVKALFSGFGKTTKQGAATSVFLATSKKALTENGKYWAKSKMIPATLPPNEKEVAKKLWEISEQLTEIVP